MTAFSVRLKWKELLVYHVASDAALLHRNTSLSNSSSSKRISLPILSSRHVHLACFGVISCLSNAGFVQLLLLRPAITALAQETMPATQTFAFA